MFGHSFRGGFSSLRDPGDVCPSADVGPANGDLSISLQVLPGGFGQGLAAESSFHLDAHFGSSRLDPVQSGGQRVFTTIVQWNFSGFFPDTHSSVRHIFFPCIDIPFFFACWYKKMCIFSLAWTMWGRKWWISSAITAGNFSTQSRQLSATSSSIFGSPRTSAFSAPRSRGPCTSPRPWAPIRFAILSNKFHNFFQKGKKVKIHLTLKGVRCVIFIQREKVFGCFRDGFVEREFRVRKTR